MMLPCNDGKGFSGSVGWSAYQQRQHVERMVATLNGGSTVAGGSFARAGSFANDRSFASVADASPTGLPPAKISWET
jgi:hypothetical protein